jgi:hypothetical protein
MSIKSDHHKLAPPRELVKQWIQSWDHTDGSTNTEHVAAQAAQWGADQQLAEDAKWLDHNALNEPYLRITPVGESLKEAMRPKPPSLKEQALAALETEPEDAKELIVFDTDQIDIIRRALEALPE